MKVIRKELLEALAAVQPGLASKEIVEQSQSFIFQDGKVLTCNDEIAISHPVDLDIEGAVKGEELFKLLNKSRAKELTLEVTDNELLLETKSSKAGIRLEAEISLPMDEIGKPGLWYDLPKDFSEALKFCLFSASRDMSRPILTCLHVTGRHVQSSDNYRITQYTMSSKVGGSLLIPAASAGQLAKHEPTKYAVSKKGGWLHFKAGKLVFSCRTYEEDYPDISGFLKVKGSEIKLPKKIGAMLERASIFSKADIKLDEQVKVTIHKNRLTITGEGEAGWFEERTKVDYEGKKIKFLVYPGFLMDTINLLDTVKVGENRLKLKGENFVHVVYLMAT